MADGRRNNGGNKNAGRKPKAVEQAFIERLSPMDDIALKALKDAVIDGQGWAVKLFLEYRLGKPKQQVDVTTNGESINVISLGTGIDPNETTN